MSLGKISHHIYYKKNNVIIKFRIEDNNSLFYFAFFGGADGALPSPALFFFDLLFVLDS